MATKAKAKATKSTGQSKRGGSRAGAGRKPKAITEMRDALITPMVAPGTTPPGQVVGDLLTSKKSAAEYALTLFEDTMRDVGKALDLRLDCAREVMNRTIGKPRQAEAIPVETESEGGITIFIPDNGRDTESCEREAV